MTYRSLLAATLLVITAAGAQEPPAPADPSAGPLQIPRLRDPLSESVYKPESTIQDQTDVAVTIYNNNLALVRDRRKTLLGPGEVMLRFADVSQQIHPETVSMRSITAPEDLQIVEQNYEFDLMSPSRMMEKYVGKNVRIVNFSNEVGFSEVDARLLSVNDGPIYQVEGDIYLGHPGTVVLPQIPPDLIAKPSLVWLLDNHGTDHEIEVTYLTGGMSWQADYVLTLNKEENAADIKGWVTLTNASGAQFTNAQLKMVAGDVNVAPPVQADTLQAGGADALAFSSQMREETFAEYHLYTLPRRTTIKQNGSKQVSLLTASAVGVHKQYELRGQEGGFFQVMPPRKDQKVDVYLKFVNSEDNRLGMPLPAGTMRVYQQDSEGMLQFSGEDRIKHTPKNEDVRLKLGNAFDIVGDRVQTDWKQVSQNIFESAYEIKVRNHKNTDIQIDIVETLFGDWRILTNSHPFVKRDATTAVFTVTVPADGETVVVYRAQVKQ